MTDTSSFTGTITNLLRQLPSRDDQAIQAVFNFYFQNLAQRAKRLLNEMGGVRITDEEDLAMLVMTAFLKDATEGELGQLRSRHDVWKMLSKRVRQRAINMVRDEKRKKKNEVGESIFLSPNDDLQPLGIQHQPGRDIHDLRLFHQELIEALEDPIEKEIGTLLLEGRDVTEIAEATNKSPATVYRKLHRIKEAWEEATNLA
jgi:DNA-directed RNA polymerase specialized sigma24 family protein